MSVQQALSFMRQLRAELRDDPARESHYRDLGVEGLCALAGSRGFDFTVEELRRAHAVDWAMRYRRFARD